MKGAVIGIIVGVVMSAAAVVLLFNTMICTISFGLIGGCDDEGESGDESGFQIVTDEEFVELGEKMRELREANNEEVDVKGKNYKDYKSVLNGEMINEAEVHLRVMYQTDWYALQGWDLLNEEKLAEEFGELEGNDKRFIQIWHMAKLLEEETQDNDSWLNKRSEEWDFKTPDWLMSVQFDIHRCYLVGDEESSLFKPSTWFGLSDTPCKDLDELYERATGEEMEVVKMDDRGVLGHTHTITEEGWECKESKGTGDNVMGYLFSPVFADHLDEEEKRGGKPDCGEGYKATPVNASEVVHMTYTDLLSVLYAFEDYSLFKTDETVSKDEGYRDYVDYILRELYDLYFGDDSLIGLPDSMPSNGWLVPMQEGTYYRTSPFGWRNLNGAKDFHYGVDMATHKNPKVPIYATKGGVVVFANPDSNSPVGSAINGDNRSITGCEGHIIIKHDDSSSATYCHMERSNILVQNGWSVEQGQLIAGVGNAGDSYGEHLDIKICLNHTSVFGCKDGNKNPEKINKDYVDPESSPVNYILNQDRERATQANINTSIKYFNEVGNALRKAGSLPEMEKVAQSFLMPGFTPGSLGGGGGKFGYLAWKYELGFKSPSTCSSGVGDLGGISCGVHQLSTSSQKSFVAWLKEKGVAPYSEYYAALKGIQTGTTAFADTWKAVGDKNEEQFYNVQEEYFSLTYFNPAIQDFKQWFGVDLRTEPYGIKEAVYSMYIQHGQGNTIMNSLFNSSFYQDTAPDKKIDMMYNERSVVKNGVLWRFRSSSYDVQKGVYNRLRHNEKCDALALLKNPNLNLRTESTGCVYKNVGIGQ